MLISWQCAIPKRVRRSALPATPASRSSTDDRLGSDRKVSFINYFDPKDTLVFLDEPARLLEKGRLAENEVEKARENRAEEMERTGEMEEAPEFFTTDEIIKFLNKFCMIGMCALEMKCKPFFVKKRFGIQAKSVNPYNSSFEMLTQDLKRLKRNGYRAVLISGSRTRAKRLAEDLYRRAGKRLFRDTGIDRIGILGKISGEKKRKNSPLPNRYL